MIEKHPENICSIIFDELDRGKDEKRAAWYTDYMFKSIPGQKYSSNILDTPFFAYSVVTIGIQIADLLTYIINQFFQGRTELKTYFEMIKEMQFISDDDESEFLLKGIRFKHITK